jgi:hypothetical protein
VNKMAEFEAHNLALPGDIVVIDGVKGISNMGGISAQTAKRQGELGAIVFGGVRDVAHSRDVGYPIWASEITPITGKWRIETIEINGEIVVAGIRVAPGDIVLADDTGVCFIPRARAAEVLELARQKSTAEAAKCAAGGGFAPVKLPDALFSRCAKRIDAYAPLWYEPSRFPGIGVNRTDGQFPSPGWREMTGLPGGK